MTFDEIIDRTHTDSLKWSIYGKDILPLWVADMDFRCPEPVMDALKARVDHGIFGYDLPPRELTGVIVERMKQLYDWTIMEKDVSFVPGCVTGFNLALRAFCKPGDAVIVQTPVYGPILCAPENHGLIRIDNPLIEQADGKYVVNYDTFEEQIILNKVKLFILCNPHNPVGRVFKRDELSRMAEICLAHDVIICSDDIHCDLVYSGSQHVPMASLSDEISNRTLTLIAPSKTFNLAGLHASVAIIQDEKLKESMKIVRQGLVGNPSSLSMIAALAAYREGGDWLIEVITYLESNRDWLVDAVAEKLPGVKMFRPEGTYLAWLDCRGLRLSTDPYHFFLEKARVGLNDGLDYGEKGRGFVRLNFGTPRSILEEAVGRMQDALKVEGLI